MKQLRHCLKMIGKILSLQYSYSRRQLLFDYIKLTLQSIIHYKLRRSSPSGIQVSSVMGFSVSFFSYSVLLNLFEEIFIFQVYNSHIKKDTPFIVDCGSNIGIAVLYFKLQYPSARIMAFEPDRATFNLLVRNVQSNNLQSVSLFNTALSDFNGEAVLYKEFVEERSLNTSLYPVKDGQAVGEVQVVRLSSYIKEPVDLLKIDTEGAELSIINDIIENRKAELVNRMIIECHPMLIVRTVEYMIELISSAGFHCSIQRDELHKGATEVLVYCDHIIDNKEHK